MAGDDREQAERSDEELLSAIFEVSKARTLLLGITETLPEHFQMYGRDIAQLLDRAPAVAQGRGLTLSAPEPRDPSPEDATGTPVAPPVDRPHPTPPPR